MSMEMRSVMITGASSGIGRACALQMSRAGWRVFAAVRKAKDRDEWRVERIPDLVPVILDVQDRRSILTAAEQIASEMGGSGLDGLVNVAGIGLIGPVEYATEYDVQKIFDVNLFGQIAVTQAFLPMIRKKRGRIVNISSVGAHIAIPFGALLNASKSAFGILSDNLRLELHPFGIHVSTIEPGAIATPAVDKTLGDVEGVINNLPAQGRARYGEMVRNLARRGYEREKNGSPPEVVARAVYHALTSNSPRIRYRVGKHASLLATLARILPDKLLDAFRFRALGLPTKFGAIENHEPGKPLVRAA